MNNLLSISQVANLIGVRRHRIEYALSANYLPEPRLRLIGKRFFDPSEVCVIASYFGRGTGGESCSASPT
jgi:hypothetical protein